MDAGPVDGALDATVPPDAAAPDDSAPDGTASDVVAPPDVVQPDAASDSGSTTPSCGSRPTRTGDGTSYTGDGTGACSFAARTDLLFAAMNAPDFDHAAVCGICVRVTGPMGSVTVPITDLCPECATGALDLSPTAFTQIAQLSAGRVPISWQEVPCDVTGNVVFHVDQGTNPYYLEINVRNHRNRVVSLERRLADGSWHALARRDDNVWTESPSDAPLSTAHLRAIDVRGDVVEGDAPVTRNTDANASAQFAACTP